MNRSIVMAGLALVVAIGVTEAPARADDEPTFADRSSEDLPGAERAFALLFNPLEAAMSVYGAEADFVLGRIAALAVEGAMHWRGGDPATAFGAGLIVYPAARPLRGLFVEPHLVLARPLSESLVRFDWTVDALGVGATAGWQWTWDYGLTVRLGAGGMYTLGGARSSDRAAGAVALGPELVMDGSLGWAF